MMSALVWRRASLAGLVLLAIACGDEVGERERLQRELDANRQRWEALGIADYAMRERVLCFCVFGPDEMIMTVESGQIVALEDAATGTPADTSIYRFYYTVHELFELAEHAIRDAHVVRIAYDPTYSFPVEIVIDWIEDAVDDEISVEAGSLEP